MTDKEIMRGFVDGDTQKYTLVVSWIKAVVQTKLWAGRVSPDDVIGDTTMKLLLNLREDAFRLESALKTYVQRIALYTLVDAARRETKFHSDPPDENYAASDNLNPHAAIEFSEEEEVFERIVELIPPHCRELWEMVYQDKLKAKEIGNMLGISEGAVRTKLSRCTDKAREIYKKLT